MIDYIKSNIKRVAIHKVGNKNEDEFLQISKKEIDISNPLIRELLVKYFLSPFKSEEYSSFYHDIDLDMNEVFVCTRKIFENPNALFEQSINLAKHLYEQSTHPKIKGGEFYIVYFKDCTIDNETVNAIGLFKSENKDTFLKIYPTGDSFGIESQQGININKLDKGCLIFNTEEDKGYIVAVVDNLNKGSEAKYWRDDFLHIKPRKDEYFHTENVISLCKNFTSNNPSIDKTQKADILNKAVSFLKENDSFDLDDFSNQIMKEEGMKSAFQAYKTQYETERDVVIADDFSISDQALKKQVRSIKNTIKLDNNFKISIDGDTRFLEKGFDENKKLNYYKLYYKNEE